MFVLCVMSAGGGRTAELQQLGPGLFQQIPIFAVALVAIARSFLWPDEGAQHGDVSSVLAQ